MASTDTYEWRLVGTTLTASSTDRILPVINSHFYYVLSESGSGEVTIPLNCAAAGVVTEGMLVVLYYRGAIRASFLVENIRKVPASSQEGAGTVLSISGLGGMTLLDRSIIWGDGTGASKRDFTAVTKASILITLITEAQARGGLAGLTWDFDATEDSAAVPWTDSETYSLTVGTSLLDTLRGFAKTGIDFEMNYSGTGFVLSAYLGGIGTDVSDTIFFRTGTNCTEIDIDQRGNAIKNALLVAFRDGNISLTDGTSIATNGRREDLLDAKLAQSAASATTYGAAVLSTKKDTQIGRIIKVYDGISPYLFLNYILGDTVTLDIEGVETTDRILGIQCDFDGNEYSNVTIELNSLILEQNLRMQQDLDWLMNQWQTAHDSNLLEVRYWANFNGAGDDASAIKAFHLVGTKLYIGGTFTKIGGLFFSYGVAVYDIATGIWTAVTGFTGTFGCTAITSIGSTVYVGGTSSVYEITAGVATEIGKFEESATAGAVYGMTTDGTDLYVTGLMDTEVLQSKTGLASVAKYTVGTTTWSKLSTGLPAQGYAIVKFGAAIVAAGGLNGGADTGFVYSWNGAAWTSLKNDFDGTGFALAVYGTDLLVGGRFTDKIMIWDGATFETFGGGLGAGGVATPWIYSIAVYLTDVYITGSAGIVTGNIAKYSGGVWSQLTTGLNAYGSTLALYNTDLYVGGGFTQAGDKSVLGMAIYFTDFQSLLNSLANDNNGFDMGAAIHNAPASAITASDEVPFWEDVSNALRKITWANILATAKTYFDTLYVSITGTSDTQILFNDGGAVGGDADLTWDKTNNVLNIGGTPPSAAASSLNQDASGVSVGHFLWTHGATFASYLTGVFSRGTKASPTQSLLGDIALKLRGRWYDNAGYGNTQAEIRYLASEDHTTTAHGTQVRIMTTPKGSTTLRQAATFEHQTAADIEAGLIMPYVGAPVNRTLRDWYTAHGSSGVIDGTLTYVAVGSTAVKISVAAGEGFIRKTNDQQGDLVFIAWPVSTDLYTFSAPAAGQENVIFIGIEYNAGTPQAVAKAAFTDWNWHDNFPLARCSYDGTTMRILNAYAHAEDTANLTRTWMRLNFPFHREEAPEGSGGLELSVSLRALAMTAGKVWHGFNNYSLGVLASGAAFDTHYRRAGGGFTSTIGVTSFPNTQYDDGSGTLVTMSEASKLAVLWVYLDVADGTLDVMYGRGQYNSVASAQAEGVPTTPSHLTYHGRLIGRIIFQKSGASPTLVESAWTSTFAASAVGDHNLLTSLQGGTAGEYYHLTSADNTEAVAFLDGGSISHTRHDAEISGTKENGGAGTTTLTVASTSLQIFIGASTRTYVLPDVTTLQLGHKFTFINNGNYTVTINSSGGNLVYTLPSAQSVTIYCTFITGTGAASWQAFPGIEQFSNTFLMTNASGATANVGDIGYMDATGSYVTTTTAQSVVDWRVVVRGGDNLADILVSKIGYVIVNYTGTAPSAGHWLSTSTTAGKAQRETTKISSVFAVCIGSGSGGIVYTQLLNAPTDANLQTYDITTNDASTTKHGFLKKLSNVSTEFINGQGSWATPAGGSGIPNDGWISVSWSTPTRTSASVFTVAVDVTGIIQNGYKLKYTDTTTKYAVVKSVTYGAGVSTITIFVNTDYTIVGNPSAISWSDIETPFGWPDAFNFLPTYSGLTVGNGVTICKYAVKGKYIKFDLTFTLGTTSTMGDTSCTVPADCTAGCVIGNVWHQDTGTNTFLGLCLILGGTCYIRVIGSAGSYANVAALSTTVPHTWASTDFFAASIMYPW